MKRFWKWGCLGVVGIFVLFAIIGAFLDNGEVGSAPDLAVIAPTATSATTATPELVLVPTATPVPSAFTPEEQTYLTGVMELLPSYAESFTTIGEQFNLLKSDMGLLGNQDWVLKTGMAVAIIELTNEDIRGLTGPPSMAPVQVDLLLMADRYDRAMSLLTEGLDTLNAEKLRESQGYMTEGQAAMESAKSQVEALLRGE